MGKRQNTRAERVRVGGGVDTRRVEMQGESWKDRDRERAKEGKRGREREK